MMDRTGCPAASEGKMRAAFSSGLENQSLRVIGIERAIWQYRSGIDYENIQETAAITASQAYHG